MAYKPIESYGVIGDLHTVALVSMDASIDWCCLPQCDSPSIFAAILDERKGGFFKIASLYEAQHKQMYLPDSNVLLTRFLSPEGVGEVVDFMPIQDVSRGRKAQQIGCNQPGCITSGMSFDGWLRRALQKGRQ